MRRLPASELDSLAASQDQKPLPGLGTEVAFSRGMKRALRSCDTEMFFKTDGQQTANIDDAHCFEGFGDAMEFCRTHKLKDTELIFRTGRPEDDLRVRIDGKREAGEIVKWWVGGPKPR